MMRVKIFNLLLIACLSGLGFSPTVRASSEVFAVQETPQYFGKIDHFGRLTDYQISSLHDFIRANPDLTPQMSALVTDALDQQRSALWEGVERLKDLYGKVFVEKTATKAERKDLVVHESNLSIAIHRQLVLMHDYLVKLADGASFSQQTLKLTQRLNEISHDLREGRSIAVPASMGINQTFQSGQKIAVSMCKLLYGFCVRKSLSQLMDSLDEGNFLRNKSYEFIGFEDVRRRFNINSKSVFIIIGNHDQPLMDIALARKVAQLLGSERHLTMTRKSVYPIPPPESAGDVVFVIDNDPKSNPIQKSLDLLTTSILEEPKGRVSLAVYPEGMLPYTGGQMPMTVKEGAFVIARKLGNQLAPHGVPVYLVQVKTNILEHLTSTKNIPAQVVLERVERVPVALLDRNQPDRWIEANRLRAENSFNSHRGETQIDIFNSDKPLSSKIPYAMEVRKCSMIFMP